jgi:hypothetical protein
MRFVANLRDETIDAFAEQGLEPAAYLLSSHRVTPATLVAASRVRRHGIPLMADNGTKPLIDRTLTTFATEARAISLAAREVRRTLGHAPRAHEWPAELRAAAAALAMRVDVHCESIAFDVDPEALLAAQLSMAPTALIAQEDFAIAARIGLGLEADLTGEDAARLDTCNRRSLQRWQRVAADPRCTGIDVYAVLGALDFDAARRAARLAANAGVRHVALGFAAIGLDGSATDSFQLAGRRHVLERAAPRRYLRLAQLAAGLAQGFRDERRPLASVHLLGLGAPALLPVLAAGFDDGTALSLDATSPIHDAVRDHVLYDPARDGERWSTRAIVDHLVHGHDWPLSGPFLQAFAQSFGHDPAAARRAWQSLGEPEVDDALLARPGALAAALPLFTDSTNALRRRAAQRAHIAHNHWVLDRLAAAWKRPQRSAFARADLNRRISGTASVTTAGLAGARAVFEAAAHERPAPSITSPTPGGPMHTTRRHAALRQLLEAAPPQATRFDPTQDLVIAAQSVSVAVARRDWPQTHQRALHALGLADATLSLLRGRAGDRFSAPPVVASWLIEEALRAAAAAPAATREAAIGRLREAVAARPEQAKRLEPSLALLERGLTESVPLLESLQRRRRMPGFAARGVDHALAATTKGLLGLLHTARHDAFEHWSSRQTALLRWPLAPIGRAAIEDFQREIDRHGLRLQGELAADPTGAAAERAADELSSRLREALPPFARLQAALHSGASATLEAGRGQAAERLGALAARAGGLLREAVAATVAGRRLAFDIAQARHGLFEIDLATQARRLPYDAPLSDAKNVELAKLSQQPTGSEVDLAAFVDTARVLHDSHGKLISRLTLLDPSSGARATADALFLDAEHLGITPGCFCLVRGATLPPVNGAPPSLRVARLGAADLEKRSWRQALLRSAGRWFDVLRNGNQLTWSPGPPSAGGATETTFLRLMDRE